MPEFDEFGIPIKSQSSNTVQVDEFGIPIKTKAAEPLIKGPTKKVTELPTFEEQKPTFVGNKYDVATQADRNSVLKGLSIAYNNVIKVAEDFVTDQMRLTPYLSFSAAGIQPGEIPSGKTAIEKTKKVEELRKNLSKNIQQIEGDVEEVRAQFSKLKSSYTTRAEEEESQKIDILNSPLETTKNLLLNLPAQALSMVASRGTGGYNYFLRGFGSNVEDYDKNVAKNNIEPNENARLLYGTIGGIVSGTFDKFASDKIFGKDSPAFKKVEQYATAEVIKKLVTAKGKAITTDYIDKIAKEQIKKITSSLVNRGARFTYKGNIEGLTETGEAILNDIGKYLTNIVQGEQAFDEKDIRENFVSNLVNSYAGGFVTGGILGMGFEKVYGREIKNQLLEDVAAAKTTQDFDNIKNQLEETFVKNNYSEEERDIVMKGLNRYAQIKQTIPQDLPKESQYGVIKRIDERFEIDDEINSIKGQMEQLDESMKKDAQATMSLLEGARVLLNDEIYEITSGEKYNYTEENGKYYKQVEGGTKEEISKDTYELSQIKTIEDATTKGQKPIQEGRAEGDISQRQGTQEEGAQGAPTKTDIGYRYIVSEEGDEIPVAALVNKKVKINGEPAILYREGQRIVARVLGTNRILDTFGSISEMANALPSDYGIEVEESLVTETPTGYRVEGAELNNTNENPIDAISYDKNGNVMNVVLTTPAGKRRKFRGEVAKDLAYQITLKEALKNEQEFERFLEQEHQQELENARLQAAAEEQAVPAVEPVPTETKITVEPAIARVTEDNIADVDKIEGTPVQKKVLMDIKPVVSAIANAVRKITGSAVSVNLHDQNTFAQAVIQAGGTQEESTARGFYMAGDGSIHLNMDNIDSDTMLHEGFHPILDALEKFNPQVINELFDQLSRIPEAAQIIADAKANYEGDVTQKKEAITDFVAAVADGRVQLNPSNFQKIKAFILDMLAKIGLGSGSPQLMKVDNEADLIKLANFITERFKTGETITLQNLENVLIGVEQYDSSTGLDINETLPQQGTGLKPQFSKETLEAAKNNAKSIKDFINTQISRVVFYDITRVGKLSIKNIKTGYTPDVDGNGGPFYSYKESSIKNKAVLAFVSINQAIQSLQRQILYPEGVHAIATQNPLTAHLGNKSTLRALFGEGIGIFQNAAKTKAQEKEIVGILVSEIERMSKMPPNTEASKSVNKILEKVKLSEIKTINDFRDKILLGEGDSFGKRGSILTELLQNKQSKVTAATRDSHKILHYKYGIPTIADIAQGNNQTELSNVELGDVVKLVKPSTEPVIYTTDKEAFDRYSKNPTPEMKKGGIRIELLPETDAHESYPFILAGENVALLDEYIGAQKLYDRFKGIKKSQTFFKIGRMKKYAEAGIVSPEVTTEQKGPAFQKEKKYPTKTIKKSALIFAKDNFISGGLLGNEIGQLQDEIGGEISAELKTAKRNSKTSMELIKKYKELVTTQDIENFLTGKPNSDRLLPDDLAKSLTQMREHVDALTERMINLGVITDEDEIKQYRANKGKYLLRSYEIFDVNPTPVEKMLLGKSKTRIDVDNVTKRLRNVDAAKLEKALTYLEKQLMKSDPTLTQEKAREKAIAEANAILAGTETTFNPKSYIGSTNVRSLYERQDIAPEIRALMGEYGDPVYNYYASIFKLASLTANRKYLLDLKQEGLGKFLFENKTNEATVQMASEGSEALKPLAGLWTFPEIKEALEKQERTNRSLVEYILGKTRLFATVYNPTTHTRNLLQNLGPVTSNGHFQFIPEAWQVVRNNYDKYAPLLETINRKGLLNNSLGAKELKSYFDKYEDVNQFLKEIYEDAEKKSKKGKVARTIRAIKRAPGKATRAIEHAYAWEDDVFKILGFVNEANRYSKAIYKKDYTKLTAEEKKDIDDTAVRNVKNTYPIYSRAPKIVKWISRNILLGNFLTIPFETVRNSYNILSLATKEIAEGKKTNNPDLKRIGYSRVAGTVAYISTLSLLSTFIGMAGVGIGGMIGDWVDDDEEKEMRNSLNLFRYPHTKNSEIVIHQFSNGKFVYTDLGSIDSYSWHKRVWNAYWENYGHNSSMVKAFGAAIKEAVDPVLTIDFAASAFKDLIDNNDGEGRKIYNKESSLFQQSKDISSYLSKKLGPGVVKTFLKSKQYYDEGDFDRLKAEGFSLAVRTYSIDIEKQFKRVINAKRAEGGDMYDIGFKDRLEDAKSIYTKVKYDKGASEREKENAYEESIDAYKNILRDVRRYYVAAIKGGVPQENLDKILVMSDLGLRRGRPEVTAITQNNFDLPDEVFVRK